MPYIDPVLLVTAKARYLLFLHNLVKVTAHLQSCRQFALIDLCRPG